MTVQDLACPCCGDVRINPEFWSKFDNFAASKGNIQIITGFLCWESARLEYSRRKAPKRRLRLPGVYERILRNEAFIIAGTVEEHAEDARHFGLEVAEYEDGVEIRLPVKHRTT